MFKNIYRVGLLCLAFGLHSLEMKYVQMQEIRSQEHQNISNPDQEFIDSESIQAFSTTIPIKEIRENKRLFDLSKRIWTYGLQSISYNFSPWSSKLKLYKITDDQRKFLNNNNNVFDKNLEKTARKYISASIKKTMKNFLKYNPRTDNFYILDFDQSIGGFLIRFILREYDESDKLVSTNHSYAIAINEAKNYFQDLTEGQRKIIQTCEYLSSTFVLCDEFSYTRIAYEMNISYEKFMQIMKSFNKEDYDTLVSVYHLTATPNNECFCTIL